MKRWSTVAAVAAGILAAPVLAACTGSGSSAPTATAGGDGTGSASATAPATSPAPRSTTPAPSRSAVPPSPVRATPSVAVSTAPPVKIGNGAPLKPDVLVTVGRPRTVTVTARGPGEIAGPAVAVPVTVRNTSSTPFDLGGVAVNVAYGRAATPASPTEADPADPLSGMLAPQGSAQGQYVFLAPPTAVSTLRVEVSSNSAARILVFRG